MTNQIEWTREYVAGFDDETLTAMYGDTFMDCGPWDIATKVLRAEFERRGLKLEPVKAPPAMERIRVISGLVWFQAPQVSRDQVRAGAEAASAMITASGADPDAVFAAWQRRKEIYQATLAWESGDDEEPEAETEEQSELSNIAEAAVQSALRVSGAVTGNIGLVAVQYRSGLRFVSSK